MLKVGYLLLLLWGMTSSNSCSKGCLRCSPSGSCLLCDLNSFYILKETQCAQVTSANCLALSPNGGCSLCARNYFVDPSGGCSQVPAMNLVANCQTYASASACAACAAGFFLADGACRPVKKAVDGCVAYVSAEACVACEEGKVLSADGQTCAAASQMSNCQRVAALGCAGCPSGYLYLPGLAQADLAALLANSSGELHAALQALNSTSASFSKACVAEASLPKCVKPTSSFACEACESGYFVGPDGQCRANPSQALLGCLEYSAPDMCQGCLPGYVLRSESARCEPATTTIEHCAAYDGKSSSVVCLACEKSYYLAASDRCAIRTLTIFGCRVLAVAADRCETCDAGLLLVANGRACRVPLAHCRVHAETPAKDGGIDSSLLCETCDDGYFAAPEDGACVPGAVENCAAFGGSATVCLSCVAGFYLSGNSCVAQEVIAGCSEYSGTVPQLCVSCGTGAFAFSQAARCAALEVADCAEPLTPGVCKACEDGFDLTAEGRCLALSPASNCRRSVRGACVLCEREFALVDGTCVAGPTHLSTACAETNLDGGAQPAPACNRCATDAAPMTFTNLAVCVDPATITRIAAVVPGCAVHRQTGGDSLRCARCSGGRFVSEAGCVDTCPADTTLYRHRLSSVAWGETQRVAIEAINVCGPKVAGCRQAAPIASQTSLPAVLYVCVACEDGWVMVSHANDAAGVAAIGTPPVIDAITGGDCIDPQRSDSPVIEPSSGPMTGCSLYALLANGGLGCVRCAAGFSGVIGQMSLPNCQTTDPESKLCGVCASGFRLLDALTCGRAAEVAHCQFYGPDLGCSQCEATYFLDRAAGRCLARVRPNPPNCVALLPDGDGCALCGQGFLASTGGLFCFSPLANCKTHDESLLPSLACLACNERYFPSADRSGCQAAENLDCQIFDQTLLGVCTQWGSSIPAKSRAVCVTPTAIPACTVYSDPNTCSACQPTHYLSLSVCCLLGTFYDGVQCSPIPSEFLNCAKYSAHPPTCLACAAGANFDPRAAGQRCCPTGQVWQGPSQNACSQSLSLYDNGMKCAIFGADTWRCLACQSGFRLTDGVCCAKGTKLNVQTGVCDAIANLPANCEEYSLDYSACTQCKPDLYLSQGQCCAKGSYWDTAACAVSPTLPECIDFETATLCRDCASGFEVSGRGSRCCPTGKAFNGLACVDVPLIFAHCRQISADGLACSACDASYYISRAACIDEGFYYTETYTRTAISGTTNCAQVDAASPAICTACFGGVPIKKDSSNVLHCCGAGQFFDGSACLDLVAKLHFCALFDFSGVTCRVCRLSGGVPSKIVSAACANDTPAAFEFSAPAAPSVSCSFEIPNCVRRSDCHFCSQCASGLSGPFCCEAGQFFDVGVHRCVILPELIPFLQNGKFPVTFSNALKKTVAEGVWPDQNCRKFDPSNSEAGKPMHCEVCWVDSKVCLDPETKFFARFSGPGVRSETLSFKIGLQGSDIDPTSNPQFTLSEGRCCPLGWRYNPRSLVCERVTEVTGCAVYNFAAGTCERCLSGRYLKSGLCCLPGEEVTNGVCSPGSATDVADFYELEGVACPFGSFPFEGRCVPVPDSNCVKVVSLSPVKCECAAGFEPESQASVIVADRPFPACEPFVVEMFRCVKTPAAGEGDLSLLARISLNCLFFDVQAKSCAVCQAGDYKVEQSPQVSASGCCPEGSVYLHGGCMEISKLDDNCQVFDPSTNSCSLCSDNFALSRGVCCPLHAAFNPAAGACGAAVDHCVDFDGEAGSCRACDSGFYLSDFNVCCEEGKGSTAGVCADISSSLCKKTFLGVCVECAAGAIQLGGSTGLVCCPKASFLDAQSLCQDSGVASCLVGDSAGTCTICDVGFFINSAGECVEEGADTSITDCIQTAAAASGGSGCLVCRADRFSSNGLCCSSEFAFGDAAGECLVTRTTHCSSLTAETCSACETDFYLFEVDPSNKVCVAKGYFFDVNQGKELQGTILDCDQYDSSGNCVSCSSGKYLSASSTSAVCCSPGEIVCSTEPGCASAAFCVVAPTGVSQISNLATKAGLVCASGFALANNNESCCKTGASGEFFNSATGLCEAATSIPNCEEYASKTTCKVCLTDLRPSDDGQTCEACPALENCAVGGRDAECRCKTCEVGFYPSTVGFCVAVGKQNNGFALSPPHCQLAANASDCTTCVTDYWSVSGVCTLLPSDCVELDPAGVCSKCRGGYRLDGSKLCESIGNNCQQEGPVESCTKCKDGFYVKQGICVELPSYCKAGDSTGCSECIKDYWLNGSSCELLDANCISQTVVNECAVCEEFYHLVGTTCEMNDSTCLEESAPSECTKCYLGYFLDSSVCNPLGSYCLEGTAANICTRCETGYFVQNNECSATPPNCEVWSSSTVCTTCLSGYLKDPSGVCQPTPGDCLETAILTKCVECDSNYVAYVGYCYISTAPDNPADVNSMVAANCERQGPSSNCLKCAQGYYIGDGDLCVAEGFSKDGATDISVDNCLRGASAQTCELCANLYGFDADLEECRSLNDLPWKCKAIDSSGRCSACVDGFEVYFEVCTPLGFIRTAAESDITASLNCPQGNNSECLVCSNGYYLDAGLCFSDAQGSDGQPLLDNCSRGTAAACTVCSVGYVLTNGRCCQPGKFYDSEADACADVATLGRNKCRKVSDAGVCLECDAPGGFYMAGAGLCCAYGEKLDGSNVCVDAGLTDCWIPFASASGCEVCADGAYRTNGNCCLFGKTWQSGQCNDIDAAKGGCKQVNNSGDCVACFGNQYLSNGRCVAEGKLWNGLAELSIPVSTPVCLQNSDGRCLKCSTSDGVCCPAGQTLAATCQPDNCPAGSWRTLAGNCCLLGKAGANCDVISASKHCLEAPTASGDDCVRCAQGYFLRNGLCLDLELFTDCLRMNAAGECLKCGESAHLETGGFCCPEGQTLLPGVSACSGISTPPNCARLTGATCVYCLATWALNPSGQCVTGAPVGCAKTNAAGKCSECRAGRYACGEECCLDNFSGADEELSVFLPAAGEDCQVMDSNKPECSVCLANNYLSGKYCTPEGEYFSLSTRQRTSNPGPGGVANCVGYREATPLVCVRCADPTYLSTGACCAVGTYSDAGVCKTLAGLAGWPSCAKFSEGRCNQCTDPNLMDSDGKCCAEREYFNPGAVGGAKCEAIPITDCRTYDRITSTCQSCVAGRSLDPTSTACCPNLAFLRVKTDSSPAVCSAGLDFPTHCEVFDRVAVACVKCEVGYYVSEGVCVQLGKFWKSYGLTPGPAAITQPHCQAFDTLLNKCKACEQSYYLTESRECLAIPASFGSCLNFDGTNCLLCDSGYLSEGRCCPEGQRFSGSACSAGPEAQCLRYASGACSQCSASTYLLGPRCCQKGQKLVAAACAAGDVTNCDTYDLAGRCGVCKNGYALATFAGGKQRCLEIPAAMNCLEAILKFSGEETPDYFDCRSCQASYVINASAAPQPVLLPLDRAVERCTAYEISASSSKSTLRCARCADGYFASGDACLPRTIVTGCARFLPTRDACEVCQAGNELRNGACEAPSGGCVARAAGRGCAACSSGFVATAGGTCRAIGGGAMGGLAPGRLESCKRDLGCAGATLRGVSPRLARLFSCHECTDTSKIPFAFVVFSSLEEGPESLAEYSLDAAPLVAGYGGRPVECLAYEDSSFPVESSTFVKIDNCALGLVDIRASLPLDASGAASEEPQPNTLAVHCGACKPGFAPSFAQINGVTSKVVRECQLIDGCASGSRRVNGCDACLSGWIFGYSALSGVDYSTCHPFPQDSNCLAAPASSEICAICRGGFGFDADGICRPIIPPLCADSSVSIIDSFAPGDVETALRFNPSPLGCGVCQPGFAPLIEAQPRPTCTPLPFSLPSSLPSFLPISLLVPLSEPVPVPVPLSGPVILPLPGPQLSLSVYPFNCDSLDAKSLIPICRLCAEGFVLTADGQCLAQTGSLEHCLAASASGLCTNCQTGFILANQACSAPGIEDCVEYSQDPLTDQTCTTCAEGFYLRNKACETGTIPNCRVYSSATRCVRCVTGRVPVETASGSVCLTAPMDPRCDLFDPSATSTGTLLCRVCSSGFFPAAAVNPGSGCLAAEPLPLCLRRDYGDGKPAAATLRCLECREDAYLGSAGLCYPRVQSVAHCASYSTTADSCSTCQLGFYLYDAGTCLATPDGVPGCEVYASATSCQKCQAGLFPTSGVCLTVPPAKLVTGCAVYNSTVACVGCAAGYLFAQGLCLPLEALNCATAVDVKTCASCPPNFGLKKEGDLTHCISVTRPPRCVAVDPISPFPCTSCETLYFLSETGVCEGVSKFIENCETYSSSTLCETCSEGLVLSPDSSACLTAPLTTQCAKVLARPSCALCDPGYAPSSDGQCVAQTTTPEPLTGCLLASSEGSCAICHSGFSMSVLATCSSNIAPNTDQAPTTPTSQTILAALAMLLLVLNLF